MQQYLDNLKTIQEQGCKKMDRTGTGTTSVHNLQLRADLNKHWPLLTTKKVSMINILNEWKWMMMGMTDVRWLQDNNCTIWDEWATISACNKFKRLVGDLGPVYGHQWRNFGATPSRAMKQLFTVLWTEYLQGVPEDLNFDDISNKYEMRDTVIRKFLAASQATYGDNPDNSADLKGLAGQYMYGYLKDGFDQIAWVMKELVTNPNSRRLIVSGWNPKEANEVALPPCHTLWQLQTGANEDDTPVLNLSLHARSTDYFLGMPYNIAFYGIMVEFFSAIAGFERGEVAVTSVDAHLYSNHDEAVATQLSREPMDSPVIKFSEQYRNRLREFGKLIDKDTPLHVLSDWINPLINEMDVRKDVIIENYNPHSAIKADVAV